MMWSWNKTQFSVASQPVGGCGFPCYCTPVAQIPIVCERERESQVPIHCLELQLITYDCLTLELIVVRGHKVPHCLRESAVLCSVVLIAPRTAKQTNTD